MPHQTEMFDKSGKAKDPGQVKSPADLPQKYRSFFEEELVMRISPRVPHEETSRYALELTLKQWRKDLAQAKARKDKANAARGIGGLFDTTKETK